MTLAPFPEAVAVDERGVLRIVEFHGESLDELLVVTLENRVLRHGSLAVGVLRLRHRIFGPGVVNELGRVRSLIAAVHHDAERNGKFPFAGRLNQLVNLRIGILPGILAVGGIQHGPFRADVAGGGIVRHLHVLAQQRHVDLLVEIRRIVVGTHIHHPAVQRIVQHLRFVVCGFHGHAGDLAAVILPSAAVFRTSAGGGAQKRGQKAGRHQIFHSSHIVFELMDNMSEKQRRIVLSAGTQYPVRYGAVSDGRGPICSAQGSYCAADRRSAGRKRESCNTSYASRHRRRRAVRSPYRAPA